MSKDENFDVCIIGSGAAGGVMAKELCEGGAKVVMLEAGRGVPPSELLSHKWPYELPYRGFRGEKQAPFYQGDIAKSIAYADSDDISSRSSARPRAAEPCIGTPLPCATPLEISKSGRCRASRKTGR